MHKDSKYVLFLDDDVRLHPGTIGALTKEMEKNPEIFIQTGYPLDLPYGSLGSYCIYEYHMRVMPGSFDGSFGFFRVIRPNPLDMSKDKQQSLLSLLVEHSRQCGECWDPETVRESMY